MNSIIEKKCKVVMLPTKEKAIKGDILMSSEMLYDKDIYPLSFITNPYWEWNKGKQHLYILSDDEPKKEDLVLSTYDKWAGTNELKPQLGKILEVSYSSYLIDSFNEDKDNRWNKGYSKKIIATTNTSLNLPQPSQQFITKFIEEYNKGFPILEILVEYEEY